MSELSEKQCRDFQFTWISKSNSKPFKISPHHFIKVVCLALTILFSLSTHTEGFAQHNNAIQVGMNNLKWRIVGTFDKPLEDVDTRGIPEKLPIGIKDLTCHQRSNGSLDINSVLGSQVNDIAYATCTILASENTEAQLYYSTDGKIRVWINRNLVRNKVENRENSLISLCLKKGLNEFIFEVTNTKGSLNFNASVPTSYSFERYALSKPALSQTNNYIAKINDSKHAISKWKVYDLPEEMEDLSTIAIGESPSNIKDTIIENSNRSSIVNVGELFKHSKSGLAYASCNVLSSSDQDVAFIIKSGGDFDLFVNGKKIVPIGAFKYWAVKVHLKMGVNTILAKIKKSDEFWGFAIDITSINFIRNNALVPQSELSSRNPIIAIGDSLYTSIADTNFTPIRKKARVDIFNPNDLLCISSIIDLKRNEKVSLKLLQPGAYKYRLYTDRDTLHEYFCYGDLSKIYDKEKLIKSYHHDSVIYNRLIPYIKRLDRLTGDYISNHNLVLEKKIAFCVYKVKQIEANYQSIEGKSYKNTGLNLNKFTSEIDNGDEYYLLYIPDRLKKTNKPVPLVVMVPYVTNNHPFYTGGIIANYDRLAYISRFAEQYNLAVVWPSARIFKSYNQTPIITKAIIETISNVEKTYKIDKEHIFLYGDCSGGLFALQTFIRKPDLFAAVGVDGPELSTTLLGESGVAGLQANDLFNLAGNFKKKPILILHSANDRKAPVELTLRLIDSIKKQGGNVQYDDLNNAIKGNLVKMYSEPEAMQKIFAFFNSHKKRVSNPIKSIETYAFSNDTVYGVTIQEKLHLGKAAVQYKIVKNSLKINTINVKRFSIDLSKIGLSKITALKINFDSKLYGEKIYNRYRHGTVVDFYSKNEGAKKSQTNRELLGPINKIFLKKFAVVQPAVLTESAKLTISMIDELWFAEYGNHVIVIDESKITKSQHKSLNLIRIVDNIGQVDSALLKAAKLTTAGNSILSNGTFFQSSGLSFAFFYSGNNGTNNIYLGTNSRVISKEMLNSLFIKAGWYDYELWSGRNPLLRDNIQSVN